MDILRLVISFIIVILYYAPFSYAACGGSYIGSSPTLTAYDHSYDCVMEAVSASTYGDTVIVPQGDGAETWSSQLVVTKGITLLGPGAANLTITSGYVGYLISYVPDATSISNNTTFRVTGFDFTFTENTQNGILVTNSTETEISNIIIDNVTMANLLARAIKIKGTIAGVIHSNTFSGTTSLMIEVLGNNAAGWENQIFQPGTAHALYIEDNTFNTSRATDLQPIASSDGAFPWVSRYNTFNHTGDSGYLGWHDMHGNLGSGNVYAAIGAEIYGNYANFSYPGRSIELLYHRGGSAFVFWNASNGTGSTFIYPSEEVLDTSNPTTGSYPSGDNQVNGQPQHVSGSYYWNNRAANTMMAQHYAYQVDGSTINCCRVEYVSPYTCTDCLPTPGYQILEDREFFWHITAGYDGSTGMGCGALGSRPAAPALSGTGYWATTQDCTQVVSASRGVNPTTPISGTLYIWDGSVWVNYYTPYTYPHPLTAPYPPRKLRIIP